MEIPRLWTERDPRNQKHVNAAFTLMAELGDVRATERTVRELAVLGLKPPTKTKIIKRPNEADAVIGAFFFLDVGLYFSNNVITTCSVCRAALQIRPETNTKVAKFCCFCCADRMLADYWKAQTTATSGAKAPSLS